MSAPEPQVKPSSRVFDHYRAYPVLWIPLRGGRYDIGPLDLLLFTTIGEH